MSFWSGEKLEERLEPEGLVVPFSASQIDCAAYQLLLGSEIYVSPATESKEPNQATIRQLPNLGEAFTIPSGQFAFLMTAETIKVPDDAIAFISIRANIKFRGLVNVSGFHVDPGYQGKLIFSVFNAGPAPVHLKRGDACFLIWYADLDRKSKKVKPPKAGHIGIPAALINPIAGGIHSFEGLLGKFKDSETKLEGRIQKVERDHEYIKAIAVVLVTIAVGVGAKYIFGGSDEIKSSARPTIEQSAKVGLDQPVPAGPPAAVPKMEPAKK
ncbi:MAG: deoxycytidine triphosphate deaminase [Hyphomicrobiaceae bacterium]|nr:deoxycytidine triphosphate deaminase [Hyphomicrobiaceae bacterium]